MPELLTPGQQSLKSAVDAFIASQLQPFERQLDDLGVDATRTKVIQASKDAGLFGMTQPAAFGGAEAGIVEMTLVREALAASNLRTAAWVLGPGPGVLAGATGSLKEDYLDAVMSGLKRGAFGFTEPDNAERPTWAERDADTLVIHGRKSYVTGGDTADFTTVLVNVRGSEDQPKDSEIKWAPRFPCPKAKPAAQVFPANRHRFAFGLVITGRQQH